MKVPYKNYLQQKEQQILKLLPPSFYLFSEKNGA